MIASPLPFAAESPSSISPVELERCIEDATYFQIRNLDVSIVNDEVRVMGVCDTYYVKQMVTVAVRELLPRSGLLNLVRVCAD